MRNYLVFAVAVAIACIIAACGGEEKNGYAVTYKGSAIKGPFYAGSDVTAFACDVTGKQTGQAFTSYIENASGNFTLDAEVSGTMIIKAEGVYFNEIYNQSSTGTIRVEAVFNATGSGTQNAFLNPISHSISACKLKKIQAGPKENPNLDAESELACAELLFTELSLPKPNPFTLETLRDIQYPYPIAFSCGISQAARLIAEDDKTKFDTELQRIMDQTKIELASGALSTNTKTIFRNGFATLNAESCRANLQAYLDSEDDGITIPPLGAALDSDGDGIPDSIDEDMDNDGVENALDCVNGNSDFVNLAVMYGNYFCAQKKNLEWECRSASNYQDMGSVGQETWNHSFTEFTSGDSHVCGLENDKIWCWYDTIIKTMIQTHTGNWKDIHAGKNRLCAISKADNYLYCWQGDLISEPLKIDESTWISISLGNEKIWGITADGSLWNFVFGEIPNKIGTEQWKYFSNDSLYAIKGDGTLWSFNEELNPIQVGIDKDWKIITGTCGIKTNNTTWCWDENSSSPIQKIGFGWSCGEWNYFAHVTDPSYDQNYCGIKTDHSLFCSDITGDILTNIQ